MKRRKKLREVKITLRRLKPGQKAIEKNYSENLGKRTKLGGKPDWIQDKEVPSCSSCNKPMIFVAQIDSIDYIDKYIPGKTIYGNEEYMFGDVGLIYVFFCFDCTATSSVTQCY